MSRAAGTAHPYFPRDAAIPHYFANTASVEVLIRNFATLIFVIVASGLYLGKRMNTSLRVDELVAMAWFLLCFFLHAFFEGYFVLYHGTLAGSQSLFAQLWKEYALSDSRYLTSDSFTVCIEALTVVIWSPLCLAIVVCIVNRHSMRYPLQVIMCVGHLFSVVLYYGTCFIEHHDKGISHSRPEFLYYWVYYFGLNVAWVLVPGIYLWDSCQRINLAFERLESPAKV